jgi:hypothetical protein
MASEIFRDLSVIELSTFKGGFAYEHPHENCKSLKALKVSLQAGIVHKMSKSDKHLHPLQKSPLSYLFH